VNFPARAVGRDQRVKEAEESALVCRALHAMR
jgi:hypothetical protein